MEITKTVTTFSANAEGVTFNIKEASIAFESNTVKSVSGNLFSKSENNYIGSFQKYQGQELSLNVQNTSDLLLASTDVVSFMTAAENINTTNV